MFSYPQEWLGLVGMLPAVGGKVLFFPLCVSIYY